MFRYAMKAAANSELQLTDRVKKFEKLNIAPIIELFLSSIKSVSDNRRKLVRNCSRFMDCEYMVHFPIQDAGSGYIYDAYDEKEDNIKMLLDFCQEINSAVLIMHRCYGFNRRIDKKEAEERFLKKVALWDVFAEKAGAKILIENYGFVWLPGSFGKEYVVSPLDHFFPWDILKFNEDIGILNLKHVGIILDIAHAVLSSNMFNMFKRYSELGSDRRFSNIYNSDLEKKDFLKIEDFIFDFIDYFHVSDSFIWQQKDGFGDLKRFLCSENLPIGYGNIDYAKVFKEVAGDKVVVMEINPEDGNHDNNAFQLRAIEQFRDMFN